MDNNLKARNRFTSTLDKSLHENLQNLSRHTRVPQTKLLDEAVENLLRKYEQEGFQRVETLSDKEESHG